MSRWLPYAAIALISVLATALVTTAWIDRRAAGGEAVRAYLLAHPEVIPEALEQLRLKQAATQIAANRSQLVTPFEGAWMGAEQPDVTLVQFFDYACGFCRASLADVERLVAEDPKLRVVFRELPILSPESEQAARASLAAAEQGKFPRFHTALYAAGPPGPGSIAAAARAAGLDPARMTATATSARADRELQRNLDLARALGVSGTPAWIVGDQALSGAVGYAALKKAVADARGAKS